MNKIFTLNGKRIFHKNAPGLYRFTVVVFMVFFLFKGNAQQKAGLFNQSRAALISDHNTTAISSKKTTSIGDFVWFDANDNGLQDSGEAGMANVMVVLYDSLLITLDTRYTDKDGHYLFENVPVPTDGNRSFIVGFYNIPPNYAYSKIIPDSEYLRLNSKADPINGKTKTVRLHSGESLMDIDGGIKSAPGIVLPLTIDQFNGMFTNGFMQLRWTTFTEINIDHFEIERSTDGTHFRQIGRLETLGSNNNNNTYTYSDLTAEKGSNFYRLVMIDNEGNFSYSKDITVSMDVKGISVLVVYPNPFSKRVVVKIRSEKNSEQATIRIINSDGIVLKTQLAAVFRGDNNITVKDVSDLPGGTYFLEVIAENRSMKTKLMKQ